MTKPQWVISGFAVTILLLIVFARTEQSRNELSGQQLAAGLDQK